MESTQTDVLETVASSTGIVTVSLSVPTTEGAVVVTSTSPVFQQASSEPRIKTYADLCNSIVGNQQQSQPENHQPNQLTQHHVTAQVGICYFANLEIFIGCKEWGIKVVILNFSKTSQIVHQWRPRYFH